MRTIHTIKANNKSVVAYYSEDESLVEQGEYYTEEQEQGNRLTQTEWFGHGAMLMGLAGEVHRQTFTTLLKGEHPITGRRLRPSPSTGVERLALDFTLSAPKSVSMALHLGGDVRVFDAHLAAARETLELVEDRYAQARKLEDQERVIQGSKNITAALINHHTSREWDCQLHTHCVVMNVTQRSDGEWRSLFPEGIMHADWVGHYYRNALALRMQSLGYEIYQTRDAFEIEGISREDITVFSKRTAIATERVLAQGLETNAKNLKAAAHATRRAKKVEQTLEELQQAWRAEAELAGISVPLPQNRAITVRNGPTAQELIDGAIAHLSERLVKFRREDLYRFAFAKITPVTLEALDGVIDTHPELIHLDQGQFTTQTALAIEKATLAHWQQGQSAFTPMGEAFGLSSNLNEGQRVAIAGTLQSTHQILSWHGLAGVGKTFALGELVKRISLPVRGLAPTRQAAFALANSLEIETDTVAGHLLKSRTGKPELWIVDEAGLLDSRQALRLLEQVQQEGARVLLVGDTRQNQSIGAGAPLQSLIDHGMENFNINRIMRQQNDIQRRAVELISAGKGGDALALLDEHGYVTEAPSTQQRTEEIAQEFLTLSLQERARTLIVAGTNDDRKAITQALREGLQREGNLGVNQPLERLVGLSLTTEQKSDPCSYDIGDYLRLQRDYKSTGLQRGTLYRVVKVDGDELCLVSPQGRPYRLNPRHYKEKTVYRPERIDLAVGDRVRWTRNDRSLGLSNGDSLQVAAIDQKTITLASPKGKRLLPRSQPLDIDYGYTLTTYQGQGASAYRVLLSSTSDSTSCLEPIYVGVSRQRQELKIWTEDKEQLYKLVGQSLRQQNPLELLAQMQATQIGEASRPETSMSISNSGQKTDSETSHEKPAMPIKVKPFWIPEYNECPPGLMKQHWEEMQASAIHPDLIALNIQSITGEGVIQRLLEDKLAQLGSGQTQTRPMQKLIKTYRDLADSGGWWGTAGVNPHNDWRPSTWGCFKGDRPRLDADGDPRKYENPIGVERQFYLANVPDVLAAKILAKHGVNFKSGDNFWKVVHEANLPIVYTEGFKKALSGLSQGEICIGVAGINALYQANEVLNGQKSRLPERRLSPPAHFWATPGREITFAFDQDQKLSTILNVRRDSVRAIELLPNNHCRIARWNPQQGKGIDDLIVHVGPQAFAKAIARSVPAEQECRAHYRFSYNQLKKNALQEYGDRLTPKQIDSLIWIAACRKGDIHDGNRVISQSDFIRKYPTQKDGYLRECREGVKEVIGRSRSQKQGVRGPKR